MKRLSILTLLLAFTMAAPTLLHAQIIKGEVFVGGITSQVDGDECYGFRKFGVHAGAGALIPVYTSQNVGLDIGLEVLFNQKGAYKKRANVSNSTFPYAYNLRLNYAEIPLMFYVTDKDRYSLGVGVSYGRVVYLDEKQDGISTGIGLGDGVLHWRENDDQMPDIRRIEDINELDRVIRSAGFNDTVSIASVIDNSHSYRAHDFSICADMRIRIWEGIHAELRYQYSLRPLRYRMFYEDAGLTLANQIRAQYNNSITLRVVYIFNEHRSKANKASSKEKQ